MRTLLYRSRIISLSALIAVAVAGAGVCNAAPASTGIHVGPVSTTMFSTAPYRDAAASINPDTADAYHSSAGARHNVAAVSGTGTAPPLKARDDASPASNASDETEVTAVPEPSVGAMLLMGLVLICFASGHRHRNERFSD
jgi:hypothetical protein